MRELPARTSKLAPFVFGEEEASAHPLRIDVEHLVASPLHVTCLPRIHNEIDEASVT
jgi:hypothetical protein